MTEPNLPPALSARLKAIGSDVYELKRRQYASGSGLVTPITGRLSAVFSYPGILSDNVLSPRYYPEVAVMFSAVRVSVNGVGSANVVVELAQNGGAIQQVTLGAGLNTVQVAATITMVVGDYLTVRTVTSSGATDMAVDLTPSG